MSRPSDSYFGRGSRRRTSEGYGRQYGDSYGSSRSSQDYSRDRSSGGRSQGRGLMVNPWEGGMVPGSGGVGGRPLQGTAATPDIVASINHLSRMDNPESELALNILNAVLTNDEQYYGSGRGILPTPQMPPRKLPRREPSTGPAYSWGVVGGFVPGRPGRGRGGATGQGYKKKPVPTKKKVGVKEVKMSSSSGGGGGGAKVDDKSKAGKIEEKAKEGETSSGKKTDDEEGKAERNKEGTAAAEREARTTTGGETATTKTSVGETERKKEPEPKKKKEECPVPLSYLRCHICHMHKFNNGSNFMDHVRSKKHRRMTLYYQEKINSTMKMLKAQSRLKSQRHIVSVVKKKGRITRCEKCECPIKGGMGPHLYLREHALVYHFTKCFTCKKKFPSRAELEAHKLTFPHMKAQSIQDAIAHERFLRRSRKQGKETIIPEQKLTEEFHEMVTQMQLNNLSTQVWNRDTIPIYDPAIPIGLNHLVKQSLFVCAVCPKKVSQTAQEALEHCKSREHYDCYQAHLKAMEEKEGRGETTDKENEEKTIKKEATVETQIKKETEEDGNEKDTDAPPIKKEEEEEEEEEEELKTEIEDEGMKDMHNMEVIDEEVELEEEEEEEEEGGDFGKDGQEEEEEEADGDVMVSVEEVGEDLEDELEPKEEEEEEEEAKDTANKTTASSTPATLEDKTEASSSQNRPTPTSKDTPTPTTTPAPKASPTPAPEPSPLAPTPSIPAPTTAQGKAQTRQGRGRGRGRARGRGRGAVLGRRV